MPTKPEASAPAGAALLTTAELAGAIGRSPQAVDKLRRRGMPFESTRRGRGGEAYLWSLDRVRAWMSANVRARKPRKAPPAVAVDPAPSAAPAPAPAARARARAPSVAPVPRGTYNDPADDARERREAEEGLDLEAVRRGSVPRSVVDADLRLKFVKERLAYAQLRKLMGELIPAQEARALWTRRVADARRLLDSMPAALAVQVCAKLGLKSDRAGDVEDALADAMSQAMARLSGLGADEAPADGAGAGHGADPDPGGGGGGSGGEDEDDEV